MSSSESTKTNGESNSTTKSIIPRAIKSFRDSWKAKFSGFTLLRKPTSKKSDKIKLVHRDGRIFLQNASYIGPTDETEVDRLNEQHYMLRYLVGSNAVAPLDTIPLNNVLDLGTGTGIWVLEMAHDYPDTAFVGVDINTVNQPSTVIPSNASFMQADILKGLPFPNESFDYIHARLLAGGIPRESWRNALVEYQRLLRPGGFLELIEPDMVIRNPGAVGMQLANVVPEFLRESYRMDFTIFPDTFTRMIETGGFSPVNMVPLEAPLGKWAGMAGDMMLRNYMGVIGMFKGPMTRAGLVESEAWVDAQLQEWIGEVNRNHSFTHYYYYVARKPQHVTKE